MATWVAHFHIAQGLLEAGFVLDRKMFVVGNIAPDSGVLKADKSGYEPTPTISHWLDEDNNHQYEKFYREQIAGKSFSDDAFAFRIGYYCHLFADQHWAETIYRPKKQTPLYAEPLAEDQQFIWEIKKDWYGLDFLYLKANPSSIFFTDFVTVDSVPDYIEGVFPVGAFTMRVRAIAEFYTNPPEWDLDRPYIYLNQDEWDTYVNTTCQLLITALDDKGIKRA